MVAIRQLVRGEVWWFEPPNEKRRPYVILTRTETLPFLSEVVAAPLTRRARSIPTEVALDLSDGVPTECVVALDGLAPVGRAFLTQRITQLPPSRMAEICRALQIATGC